MSPMRLAQGLSGSVAAVLARSSARDYGQGHRRFDSDQLPAIFMRSINTEPMVLLPLL